MSPKIFFAENYTEARTKFLAACAIANVPVANYAHSLAGPDGEELAMDACYLGKKDARYILVLTSGVHGTELMTGSGCQVGLLANGYFSKLPADVGVLMIHAANPWGAAHLRRNNEDNVDLCRNFIDFANLPEHNQDYDNIKDDLPFAFIRGAEGDAARKVLDAYKKEHGDLAFGRGFMAGQYHDPDGVSFGGKGPVWSRRIMEKLWEQYAGKAEKICFVDYHSGLGPYGYCTTVCLQHGEAIGRSRDVFGEWIIAPREVGHESDGKTPDVNGHTTDGHEREFGDKEITSVVLEYGVKSYEFTAEILMREHRLHSSENADEGAISTAKEDLLRAFYPRDVYWRRAVWNHSLQAVEQAVNYLAEG